MSFGEEASSLGASGCSFVILASFLRGVKAPGGRCYVRGRFVVPFLVLQRVLRRDHSARCSRKGWLLGGKGLATSFYVPALRRCNEAAHFQVPLFHSLAC